MAVSPEFRAAAGFVNRTDVVDAHVYNRLSFYGEEGAFLETIGGFTGVNRIWDYSNSEAGPIEGGESMFPSATLRGGWNVNASLNRNFYTYLPADYVAYDVISAPDAPFSQAFDLPEQETNQFSGSLG